ncbi:MAG: HDIG domain-containing protein [Bacteroidales bacterium]|nr:HDIG domain-containing protein [Bacteroidales bacterium]MCF8349682.1 HDIG domain-containing protein [Bacteroidales bacterium]MCF8374928.1 HDIG domain-containing protein [Bacteroidales bacterium]MCF8400093.1 HDIG domain-containing protein [Bacteroidales bacterium]
MRRIIKFVRNNKREIIRIGLFVVSIIVLVMIFPKEGKFKYDFQKGRPWMHEDLIAPFDFAILKPEEEIEKEKEKLLAQHRPYFRYDSVLTAEKRENLISDFERSWEGQFDDTSQIAYSRELHRELARRIYDSLLKTGIVKLNQYIEDKPGSYVVYVLRNQMAEERSLNDLFTIRSAYDYINRKLRSRDSIDQQFLRSVLEDNLVQNVIYDEETTAKEREALLNNLSLTRGMVQSGERVISKGDLVTTEKSRMLESLREEFEVQLGSSSSYGLIVFGQALLVTISITVLMFFLLFFRKDVYIDLKKLSLILLLVIFMVLITSMVVKLDVGLIYLVPICLTPIVIRAFFDTRLALYVHIITIITIGFLVPNSFEFVFSQLIAGIIAVFSVVELQRRGQFFLTSMMIFLTYSLVYVGLILIQEGNLYGINPVFFLYFAGSAILTLFSYPLIYLLEKVFGLITDVTLMELQNSSSTLLRELAMRAPGTFQHSMQVANLAEEAIFEVGGNALLVRTGAMYHDIGKMERPEYFIENQTFGLNPHEKISFEKSARIIIDHVIKGVEMARKHNLPRQIIDFIRTHHGTRKVEYFYLKQIKEHPDQEVDESKYTYPGPKPFSKETAILMMADTVEAASRSIKEPDVDKIDRLVENIIEKQVEEDQFIYCDITLREITKIKELFKKKLMSIYHLRIEYPDQKL